MTVLRQTGELARLRVLGGPDAGTVFVITTPHVTMGRGDENDVVLTDIKASRKHVDFIIQQGTAVARDLGSANGLLVNGVPQRQVHLKSRDKIGVGTTVLEFIGTETGATQFISTAPAKVSHVVGSGSSGLTQFIQRPSFSSPSILGPQTESFFERNKKFALLLVGLIAVATLLPTVEKRQKAKKAQYLEPKDIEAERSLSGLKPPEDPQSKKTADRYFKEGFREYRSRNFTRALQSFETALQVDSSHALSNIYIESTKKEMEKEAKSHIEKAKKDEESNRFRGAYLHYEAVKRLYLKNQTHALYKEAQTRMEDLQKKIKEQD